MILIRYLIAGRGNEPPLDPPLFCFVLFDSLRPINNHSVKQGRVFLGWTSTELG